MSLENGAGGGPQTQKRLLAQTVHRPNGPGGGLGPPCHGEELFALAAEQALAELDQPLDPVYTAVRRANRCRVQWRK